MKKKIIGNATLFLGDCMDLMKQYPDKYFDLAIVDPPYGGAFDKTISRTGGTWAKKYKKKINTWDIPPNADYFQELFRVSKYQIIFGGNYFNLPPSRNFIIWQKHIPENFTMSMCEYAWTNIKDNAKLFKYPSFNKDRIHPSQKPIPLYKWLLSRYAKPEWKILDTHFGSGSLAVACNELGFNLTASEIDKEYYNTACKRIEKAFAENK